MRPSCDAMREYERQRGGGDAPVKFPSYSSPKLCRFFAISRESGRCHVRIVRKPLVTGAQSVAVRHLRYRTVMRSIHACSQSGNSKNGRLLSCF